ncbi:MAG: ATP-binding protein [Rhodocyclales bacterium]|nr:ATP-binding protein [Rhodocyclales bacterium]
MKFPIPNLAVAGYRSFGRAPQYFESFRKINIFIAQNNSGKSNILRFLKDKYPQRGKTSQPTIDALERHIPDSPPMLLGYGEPFEMSRSVTVQDLNAYSRFVSVSDAGQRATLEGIVEKILKEKARLDNTSLCWSLHSLSDGKIIAGAWSEALKVANDGELATLWRFFTNMRGGDRPHHWEPETIARIPRIGDAVKVEIVPAIRQIGSKGSASEGFDGAGIIDRLAKLQNPGVHEQDARKGFRDVSAFVCDVLSRPDAEIEIPYERDTILIHMDQKVLPIESLGSGVHEVVILAAAATVLNSRVLCIEEPELHLNPTLQKKLMRYLADNTTNQYFITSHSAALMDTPDAEIYHIRLLDGYSVVDRVTSDRQRSAACEDLGYHPSDLLQANCIIWVEGPSDRIYLNWWIHGLDSSLVEGIHYSIMFYGGRLAAHLTNNDLDEQISDFISLRRLNRRGVVVIDSDRGSSSATLNATKQRISTEFNSGPGFAWITAGREIENYLPEHHLTEALSATCKSHTSHGKFGRYDKTLRISNTKEKECQAPKVDIARHIAATFDPDYSRYDLKEKLAAIVQFIHGSNPSSAIS